MYDKIAGILNDPELSAKLTVAISSSFFLIVLILLFAFLYRKYFWKNEESRRLFWIVSISLGIIVVIKFFIGVFFKGYIPELLFFYAIPSPKLTNFFWLGASIAIFIFFLRFRKKIESLSSVKFLLSLFAVFFIFSVSVAAIREGLVGVAEPYTKVYWEYAGNFPLIHTVKDFLRDYISLIPRLAQHSTTHPPGYTLILYFFHKVFFAGYLGMAIFTVFSAGLVLLPIYYIWKEVLPEAEVRRALELFIFIPSLVMMTATSTESFLLLFVWTAIAACFIGWKRSWLLSILGGLFAAAALLCNFLFLLLGPFFIFLCWQSFRGPTPPRIVRVGSRVLLSLAAFIAFFVFLKIWSNYSIIDNFFSASVANQHAVRSNFESVSIYLLYLVMNLASFLIYFGLPFVYIFFSGLPGTFKNSNLLFKSGVAVLIFFLAAGVFQGNVERLWLFILPFFPIFANKLFKEEYQSLFAPYLALTFFQILVVQIIFYTFF